MSKKPFVAEDLYELKYVSQPEISHDGETVVYVQRIIDQEKHRKYYSHLWRVSTDGKVKPEQLTRGKQSDSTPKWSPDDSQIAFVSNRNEEIPQIFLLPVGGGEAQQLTTLDRGEIGEIEWSPDGKKIAFTYAKSNKPTDDDGNPEEPAVRRITKKWYKLQGKGFLDDEYKQIYVVTLSSGKIKQITATDFNHDSLNWTPDSKALVFGANPTESSNFNINDNRIYIQKLDEEEAREIPKQEVGPAEFPQLSPDGKWVAYIGHTDPDEVWGAAHRHLWLVPVDGSEDPKNVNPEFDRSIGSMMINDAGHSLGTGAPLWSRDGTSIYCLVSDSGAVHIYKYDLRDESWSEYDTSTADILGLTFDKSGSKLACLCGDATEMADVYVRDMESGSWKRLTAANDALFKKREIVKPECHWFDGVNGKVQGWLMKPARYEEGKKYPSILEIHGGPRAMYGDSFFFEFQLLASRGYVVFYCNPSGSQGYSESFARSITNDWGGDDYKDCVKATDFFEQFDCVNKNLLGVTGGSYGGYMTNWLVGHTDRFKGGVTQRSVVNMESMAGTSDFGFTDKAEFGGPIWENREGYRRMSPLEYVEHIETPLLIIHSEQDLRCPMEQAEQLYSALRLRGIPVEFLRFPEESHELSRSGRPDRRVIRLEAICDWFDEYVK